MGNKQDDGKRAKLSDGAGGKERDDAQDGVVGNCFEGVRRACDSKTSPNALFHGKSDGC